MIDLQEEPRGWSEPSGSSCSNLALAVGAGHVVRRIEMLTRLQAQIHAPSTNRAFLHKDNPYKRDCFISESRDTYKSNTEHWHFHGT